MATSPRLSGTVSPTRCPICLEYHSTDTAVLTPCGHKYDVECIAMQMKMHGESSRQCPMCRTKIGAVKYNFTPDDMYQIHVPGERSQDMNPFLRDDEIVQPGASDQERRRKFELRKLRTLKDISAPVYLVAMQATAAAKNGELVILNRETTMTYEQNHGVNTKCEIERELRLWTIPLKPIENHKLEPDEVVKARLEVRKWLDRFQLPSKYLFSNININCAEHVVECDDRGLKASVNRGLTLRRKPGNDNTITISEWVELNEEYLAELPGEGEPQKDVVKGLGRREREKAVNMARQEMQGIFELYDENKEFEKLDKGTTEILDMAREEDKECHFCDVKHRNGDCMLPDIEQPKYTDGIENSLKFLAGVELESEEE